MAVLTDTALITLAWAYFVFLPGWVLSRMVRFENDDLTTSLVTSFVLGLTACTPILLLGYTLTLPVAWVTAVLAAVPAVLLAFAGKRGLRLRIAPTRADAALLGIALVLGILGFLSKAYQDHTADSMVHLALIRRILESGSFGLHIFDHLRPMPGEAATQSWMLAGSYSYNAWYGILAVIAYVSRTDPIEVWAYFPLFFGILSVSVFWLLGKVFLGDKRRAAAAIIGLLLFGWTASTVRGAPYPNHIVHFIMYAALCFSLLYAKDGQRRHAIAAISVGIALAATHPQGFFQFGLLLIGALAVCAIVRDLRAAVPRLIQVGAVIVLLSAPLILVRSNLMSQYATDMSSIMETYRRDVGISDRLYVLDVRPMLRENPLVWFLFGIAFVAQIKSLIRSRTFESAFLVGGIGILVFIAFNPLIYPLITEYLSPVMARRTLGPLVWLFGPLLLARWLGRLPVKTTLLSAAALIVIVAGVGMAITKMPRSITRLAYRVAPMLTANPLHAKAHDARYCGPERTPCLLDVVHSADWQRLRERLTPRSVVVADLRTTRLLASIASIDPVTLYFARTPAEKARSNDAESVLTQKPEARDVLARYRVAFVVQKRDSAVYDLYRVTPGGLKRIDSAKH